MNQFLSREQTINLINQAKARGFFLSYEKQKHRLEIKKVGADFEEKDSGAPYLRLPISIPSLEEEKEIDPLQDEVVHYIILLIQSGSCALGYFENEVNLDHKVFRAYMVRKKQGKSQVKHLKTKGKSRAGSRVRLAGTLEFFEEINARLQVYFNLHQIDRIALSLPKILMPYFYDSKVNPPFDKKDERLLKIPKHIHTPKYEVLLNTQQFLLKGELFYEKEHVELLTPLMGEDFRL